ncbi:family 31 carbohydrate-binding protein [Aquimarina latercula]|uniref:family 31 carbohydrate-binding protein n=1 Tax=Aquimarina latercula TaxID=987 RepID=UPI0004090E75|nr:family 31 carbohydrate-binding protein [Aquimarina latercula]
MREQIKLTILFLIVCQTIFSQSSDPGLNGEGMNRMGFIHRYENWIYPNNILSEWKKNRGDLNPSSASGLLSNPYRNDGTSLSYGITIPNNFNGKIPVFTEGNWWPTIGNNQGAPLTYGDLETDTGATFQNGQIVNNPNITRRGIDRVKIVNNTPYSYLVSSGTFPGNEQPGQVMTVIPANGEAQLPIPPKDWWGFNFNGQFIHAVPEVYSSVAGLNPLDAPGWKHSSWSPRYSGGEQARDFGTGGFAYTFGSLFGRNDGNFDLSNVLFAGFHTNEGYDPLISGDPGYGCAFYINGEIQAVMNISLTGTHTAQAILVAQTRHNPAPEQSAFGSGFSHLKSIIGVQPGQTAELHYISHEEALKLINTYSSNGSWKRIEKNYQSNTQANVQNVPLPGIIPGNGDSTPTCNDNQQNGDETGVDCGGSCDPCETTSTCSDNQQNGDETGIDCGGSCSPCDTNSINYITGKFVIDGPGTLLAIGQDVTSIDNFSSSTNTIPAATSGYTSINNVEAIDIEASYGTGPQHLASLASKYPNSGLVVAVYLVDHLQNFNSGNLDNEMDSLIDKLIALDRPIYLRWGYEFDGPHNHYDPNQFVTAWRKMYNRIQSKNADNNIAMVWHSGAFCGSTYNNNPISSWYPGKSYVDLMGISVFTPQDCNYRAQDTLLDFARQEGKPVIIAEATPQGYDVSDNTIAPVFGNNVGVKTQKTAQQIWDEWYQPFFNYIDKNKDVIRLATYINADWDSQGFWDAPYQMGYWGDSRVQANNLIASNWNQNINSSNWIKASDELFDLIGYTSDNTDNTTTCNDNQQNGDETGIDCGGSCSPCETDGDNDSSICGEFGMSYINDNTARVYHKDNGYQSNIYMCVDNSCYPPSLENGYYYFDFSSSTTYTFVTMNLGQNYTIKFQADYTDIAEKSVTFNTENCTFNSSRENPIITKNDNGSLIIFPNPSEDYIELEGPEILLETRYQIYTLDGKEIKSGKGKLINISTLKKGIFILKTDKKEYKLFTKK